MTAIMLDDRQFAETQRVSREIGTAFGRARRAKNDRQMDIAQYLGVRREVVSRFESGKWANVKLGSVVRFLGLYGMTVAVAPMREFE